MKRLLIIALPLLLVLSCGSDHFGPGVYIQFGHGAYTPEEATATGIKRLYDDHRESEFHFQDFTFQVKSDGSEIIKGTWSWTDENKMKVNLNYTYDGGNYSETYKVFNPDQSQPSYQLKHESNTKNTFRFDLRQVEQH